MSRDNNLVNHEVVDTFFMSDEQVDKFNKTMGTKKFKKHLLKFLAFGVLAGLGGGVLAPILAPLVGGSTFIASIPGIAAGLVSMKNGLQLALGMEDVQQKGGKKHK